MDEEGNAETSSLRPHVACLAGQVALTDALKGNFFLDLGVTLCFIELGWSENEEIVRLPRRGPHDRVYYLGIAGSLCTARV